MCHLLKKQKYPSPNKTERHTFERTEFVVSGPQVLLLIRKVTNLNIQVLETEDTVKYIAVLSGF
jgi:hypothetical protein